MGGKARWRKLQRVVGSLPQGPHASPDKHRQRQERARTRDAKRRMLGVDGEEQANTILIGEKKERSKEKDKQNACEEKREDDKGIENPHEQQEKEAGEEVKTKPNDYDENFSNDESTQEAVEHRAGVWTASPSGWVFRPLSNTTLEEELRKAQEEENGRRDRVHNNGQRTAKFFLSDDESDSDTAIFIDVSQPALTESKDLQISVTSYTASPSRKETHPDDFLDNSSEFPVQSRVQIPLEAEDMEFVLAHAIEEDEVSDPLAKISTIDEVVTNCPHHDTPRGDFPLQFFKANAAPDLVGTDSLIESIESSVNRQSFSIHKMDVAASSVSAMDGTDCIESGSADDSVGQSTMTMEVGREADATHDIVHFNVNTKSRSTPDSSAPRDQITSAISSEATTKYPPRPQPDFYDTFGEETRDVQDTINRGDSEAESLFFSLYPEYHPSELEESASQDTRNGVATSSNDKCFCSRSPYEAPQDGEETACTDSQEIDDKDVVTKPKDLQDVYSALHTTNLACDYDDSLASVLNPVSNPTAEINFSTTLCHLGCFHHKLHAPVGLEEVGTEAGQDALELESRLETGRGRQTLVRKAREWIKGVARMGGTRKGNSPILEATEDSFSFGIGKTEGDTEVSMAVTDTLDAVPVKAHTGLSSSEDVKTHNKPEGNQEDCFTAIESAKDIHVSGKDQSVQQTHQENISLHSSLKWDSWSCTHNNKGFPKDVVLVEDTKKNSEQNEVTMKDAKLAQDPKDYERDTCPDDNEAKITQNPVQHSLPAKNVINHYLSDENLSYFTHARGLKNYPTPGEDAGDNPIANDDRNVHPTSTTTLMVVSPTLEDSHDCPNLAEHLLTYPKPATPTNTYKNFEFHYIPEGELNTPNTPVNRLEIFCSSSEAHFIPEKDCVSYDTPAKELENHYTPEKDHRIHDQLDKVKETYYTPDKKDLKHHCVPADMETSYTITEKHGACHTPVEQNTFVSTGEDNLNYTPTEEKKYLHTPPKEPNVYKSCGEQEVHYKTEEEEKQMTHCRPEEDQEKYYIPLEEQNIHYKSETKELEDHYTPVEDKVHCTPEEQKDTPVDEHWPHYTLADKRSTCYTPNEDINVCFTPAEDEEASCTPESEPSVFHKPAEEISHCTSDETSYIGSDEQKTHNIPDTKQNISHYTPADERKPHYTLALETYIIEEDKTIHCTPDSKLSTPTEVNENVHTPKDYHTPVTCTPGEGMTSYAPLVENVKIFYPSDTNHEIHDKSDSDLETRHIHNSHLQIHHTPGKEEKGEEGDEKAEKSVEDEKKSTDEEERKDKIKMDINLRRKESEGEGKRDSEREEGNDIDREGKSDSEREGRNNSEREERNDSEREGRRDSEREGRKDSEKEGRNDSEREEMQDSAERRNSERKGRRNSERNERKDIDSDGRKDSEREERKYSEREERKDNEREGRRDNEGEKKNDEGKGKENIEREEKRKPSDWEWKRNSGEEGRKDSDWEKRRNSEGKWKGGKMEGRKESEMEEMKESKMKGSIDKQTQVQVASTTLVVGQEHLAGNEVEGILGSLLGGSLTSGTKSAVTTLDYNEADEEVGVSIATVPWDPLEVVTSMDAILNTKQTGVPHLGLQGGRGNGTKELKPHQKHGKTKQQHTGITEGDTPGKAMARDEDLDDIKRERKSGNKRRRNRRNRGTNQGEQETSNLQSQFATRREWTAESKSNLSHGSSWEMEVSLDRDIHYHSKEHSSQRQRESRFQTVTHQDDIAAASGHCKKSNKNVQYQKQQHQVNIKNRFFDSRPRGHRRVERFSEEQKAVGAGKFSVSGSLDTAGNKGTQNGERRRAKGNGKDSQRSEYGANILKDEIISQQGAENVGIPALSRVRSPRIEDKDRKESIKERREKKLSEKAGKNIEKAQIKSPRENLSGTAEQDGSGASKSRPALLDTPLDEVSISAAQEQELKPANHCSPKSPTGETPSAVSSRTTAKLRYPEALLQPLSPPPSPPLHKADEVEKIREAPFIPEPHSYAKKTTSQSVIYTIPEAVHTTPQQIEQYIPNPLESKLPLDRPQCPQKPLSFKDTSNCYPLVSTKSSELACLQGKQVHNSANNSILPLSCDTLQSAKRPSDLTSESFDDPQSLHKQQTSPLHPSMSFPPCPSPLQQESVSCCVVTPTLKPPLKPKTSLAELDAMQKAANQEKETISLGDPRPGVEEARPLRSPGKLSVAHRIKFSESPLNTTKAKVDMNRGDATSYKPDLPQTR